MSDRREKRQAALERLAGITHTEPTSADNASDTPTTDDNVRQSPTTDDERRLEQTTVRLARWQKQRLLHIADSEGRLLSDVVREAVREYLRRQ